MVLTIRPATLEDAQWLSTNLREDDVREIETASGRSPQEVVPLSFRVSSECYTIRFTDSTGRIEDKPVAIFGVSSDPEPGWGVMWLLGTTGIRRGSLSIIREATKWLDHWNEKYPKGIHNIVDTRNDLHVRWLQLMGFSFARTQVLVNDVPFEYATRYRKA